LTLSTGVIDETIREAGSASLPLEDALVADLVQAAQRHVDETSWPESGVLLGLWALVTTHTVLFLIGPRSRNVLHHSRNCGRAKSGDKIRDMTLAQAFAEARDAAGVTVEGKTPPTFHELRSLSLRLYHDQGINAQALAGHKSADMTAVYRDVRGDEWVRVLQK